MKLLCLFPTKPFQLLVAATVGAALLGCVGSRHGARFAR